MLCDQMTAEIFLAGHDFLLRHPDISVAAILLAADRVRALWYDGFGPQRVGEPIPSP